MSGFGGASNASFADADADAGRNGDGNEGSKDKKEEDQQQQQQQQHASNALLSLTERARQLKIREAVTTARKLQNRNAIKGADHKFWSTQPVPKGTGGAGGDEGVESSTKKGPLRHQTVEGTRKEPYPLPPGFNWCELDVNDEEVLDSVYKLLNRNYVEDDDNMFRFDYSKPFLKWAICPPGFKKELHLGVQATASKKLMGVITAIPQGMIIEGARAEMVEINFLCVHKKLRSKR